MATYKSLPPGAGDFGLTKSIDPRSGLPRYMGTPAQFIASGLLTQEQIPNEPGCPKIRVFRFGNPDDRRDYKVTLCLKSRLIKLSVARLNEEDLARGREKYDREGAARRFKKAKLEEAKELDWLPVSANDYATRTVAYLRGVVTVPRKMLTAFGQGYSFDRASLDALEEAIEEALDDFEASARVTYRKDVRDQCVASVKAKTAQADPAFKSMMAVIVAGTPPADGTHP